jgi:uroporphyrinogen III methyltransferase/synthase
MHKHGKVFLIGAGPGNPDLITLSGLRALQNCDVVVYDRLAPLELVVTLPRHVQRIYVGKSSGNHSLPQEEIHLLLLKLAQEGRRIARLKGGDPFVFGRGAEEAIFLRKNGIPFEVIPGITAGVAAPAFAGIPVTYRNKAVFAVFLTAHEAKGKTDLQMPWEWIAGARHGSIVGYMGVKELAGVVEKLIRHGLDADTPAAIIARGTTGRQRSLRSALSELPARAQNCDIQPPALFIIGDVVDLQDQIQWFNGILAGKCVLVTRPADQAEEMYRLLRSHGADVLPLPTIATQDHFDAAAWSEAERWFEADAPDSNWLVFTSENGVRFFLNQLVGSGRDHRWLGRCRIAAVGEGTAKELAKRHLSADFVPSTATTAVLARELTERLHPGDRVLRVRGNLGDDSVERSLGAAGARVTALQVYNTYTEKWDRGMWAHLQENPPDLITFTSGSTVCAFVEITGERKAKEIAAKACVASIGPMTTKIAESIGIRVDIEAKTHTVHGLIQAMVEHYQP